MSEYPLQSETSQIVSDNYGSGAAVARVEDVMGEDVPEVDGYLIGKCKWFNNQKAFGFIELPGGGLDIFVHANQLRKSGIDRVLIEGEKVKFRTSKGPKGSFAVDISLIPPSPAAPKAPEPGEA